MKTVILLMLLTVGIFGYGSPEARASNNCHKVATFHTTTGSTTTDSCGHVTTGGSHQHYGDLTNLPVDLASPIVKILPSGAGYGLIGEDGGVFTFGDFEFHGSVPGDGVYDATIVAAANLDEGYMLVSDTAQVYTFRPGCETSFRRGEWMTVGKDAGLVDTQMDPTRSVPIPDLVFDMACLGWSQYGKVNVDKAIQVSMCEAKGDMTADNGADFTMWQINRSAHAANIASVGGVQALKDDPVLATSFAVDIYDYAVYAWGNGWQPWSCARKMAGHFGERVEI